MSKTVLITGANRGIGYEIARQLGKSGHTVFLTARFTEKGMDAVQRLEHEGIEAFFVQMDVTDETSIREAFKDVNKKVNTLDVLVNNAGILIDGNDGLLTIPASKIYHTIHTNAIGALMVTRKFREMMPAGGRVVMISSGGGAITEGISTWSPVYCISKTTLNAITMQLHVALREYGISVNAVCPGWVKTDMGGSAASRTVEKGAETPVWLATDAPGELSGKFLRDKQEISW